MSDSQRKLAIVTGASGGIGVDFARELADRNYDLVLTGRNTERLKDVGDKLAEDFEVEVKTTTCDLGTDSGPETLFSEACLLNRNVDVLVNNAGLGHFGKFLNQSTDDMLQTIDVNLRTLTVLSRLFAERMAEQGGGLILNHSSFSAIQPPSDFAVYAATKAYVLKFSLAIRESMKHQKVSVSALCPGYFDSDFISKAGQPPGFFLRWLILKQSSVARAGIRGLLKKKPIIIPSLRYKFFNLASKFLPQTVNTGIADIAVSRWNKKD